ncbi:MAG: S8 family serine peptidase, partial [Gammaproteobacteria bacterium]|nr:S8 family serine peptidase [Gammaproteobacteria bacterium]
MSCSFIASASTMLGVPGQIIVKYKPGYNAKQKSSLQKIKQAQVKARFKQFDLELWQLKPNQSVAAVLNELKNNPAIALAEPNYRRYPYRLPIDPEFIVQQQEDFVRLQLDQAWELSTGSRNVRVAIIDDAIDIDHPDLKNNINANLAKNFVKDDQAQNNPRPGICFDPITGQVDRNYPEEHGTAVAGVLGAQGNNGIGLTGVAWEVDIVPIRIGCAYSVAAELAAFEYAVEQQVHIINTSYGGPYYSEAERQAIFRLQQQNILLVAAAGNFAVNNDRLPDYPSSIDLPNIISVAAANWNGQLLSWSQYGQTSVDIAAPGEFIATTLINGKYTQVSSLVESLSGTSFSAPFVSGVAALLKSYQPNASFYDLKAAMMASVDPIKQMIGPPYMDIQARLVSDGFINPRAALQKIRNPEPLIVIKDIQIDDTGASGNRNQILDHGEKVRLNLLMQNLWADASSVLFELKSLSDYIQVTGERKSISIFPGRAGEQVVSFWLDAQLESIYQRHLFQLDMSIAGQSQTRFFELETGSLELDQSVFDSIQNQGLDHNQIQYYHIDVASPGTLVFELYTPDANIGGQHLDLLVRHGGYPEFNFEYYAEPDAKLNLGIGRDTYVSAGLGLTETIRIPGATKGTYYIAVVAPHGSGQTNHDFELLVTRPKLQHTFTE